MSVYRLKITVIIMILTMVSAARGYKSSLCTYINRTLHVNNIHISTLNVYGNLKVFKCNKVQIIHPGLRAWDQTKVEMLPIHLNKRETLICLGPCALISYKR